MGKKKAITVPTAEPEVIQPEVQTPVEPIVEPEVVKEIQDIIAEQLPASEPEVVVEPQGSEASPIEEIVVEEPELPEPTQSTGVVVETPKVKDTLVVDKFLFYKMMATCIKGSGYTGFAAMARFCAILGVTKLEDQKAEWKKAQEYLKENK